jgi:hypothetical protein
MIRDGQKHLTALINYLGLDSITELGGENGNTDACQVYY